MGLRFRKSVSLFPGVKLNFGTTGMSVSTGVPGFRKTFHTSGRVTTSVGIPGTGIYYVDTKNTKNSRIDAPHELSQAVPRIALLISGGTLLLVAKPVMMCGMHIPPQTKKQIMSCIHP